MNPWLEEAIALFNAPVRKNNKTVQTTRPNPLLAVPKYRYIWVNCLSNPHAICEELVAPPLAAGRQYCDEVFSLFCVSGRKLTQPRRSKAIPTPWGESLRQPKILVGKYGLLATTCDHYVDSQGNVVLKCIGEPDSQQLEALEWAARMLGVDVKLHTLRLYGLPTVFAVARTIDNMCEAGKTVTIYWTRAMHLPLAALEVLYQQGKDYIGRCAKLAVVLPLKDKFRNMVKDAIDYMCNQGDEVACLAHHVIHRGKYKLFIEREGLG